MAHNTTCMEKTPLGLIKPQNFHVVRIELGKTMNYHTTHYVVIDVPGTNPVWLTHDIVRTHRMSVAISTCEQSRVDTTYIELRITHSM